MTARARRASLTEMVFMQAKGMQRESEDVARAALEEGYRES